MSGEGLVGERDAKLIGRDYGGPVFRFAAVDSAGRLLVRLDPPATPIAPTGVLLGVADTVVYTAPVGKTARLSVVFANNDAVFRSVSVFVYVGAGPGTDAQRITGKGFVIPANTQLTVENVVLPAGYKVAALVDVANKVNAVPFGEES